MAETPAELAQRMRINALRMHSHGKTNTSPARKASPQSIEYWAKKIDPDGTLPEDVRIKRADQARRAYLLELSLKSAKARRLAREQTAAAEAAETELADLGGTAS
jgi:hypothetical protein